MSLKYRIYQQLPRRLKPIARVANRQLLDWKAAESSGGVDFVEAFFDSREEYEKLSNEPHDVGIWEVVETALDRYDKLTPEGAFGSVDSELATACYALVRKVKPSVIVETGVCNGVSTLFILKALAENGCGYLYSVDYPYRVDQDLEEFRDETFGRYGGAAIPRDKKPGWIIPDDLRSMWTLRLGKSQTQLPALLEELDSVDLFIHDSEHSHPCMMFEYEVAWHKMKNGGTILSDDISWNSAFEIFTRVRKPDWGKLSSDVGFFIKTIK